MIAAAGSGQRLGAGGAKAFVEVAGKPLLAWSVAAFAAAESVGPVVIAAPAGEEARAGEIAATAGVDGAEVVAGGEARSQSVAAGLERVDTELVAVHDAARPLVTPQLIDDLVGALKDDADADGAIVAAPVTDTVKHAPGQIVEQTLDRSNLWAAQTPQAFRTEKLREAHRADPQAVAAATDDAMLVEKAGGKVLIHAAPPENLKVTTAVDLRLAGLLLAR